MCGRIAPNHLAGGSLVHSSVGLLAPVGLAEFAIEAGSGASVALEMCEFQEATQSDGWLGSWRPGISIMPFGANIKPLFAAPTSGMDRSDHDAPHMVTWSGLPTASVNSWSVTRPAGNIVSHHGPSTFAAEHDFPLIAISEINWQVYRTAGCFRCADAPGQEVVED